MSTINVSIGTIISLLEETIKDKNAMKTLALVLELKAKVLTDAETIKWITEPANIKNIHDLLVEHLEVPPKMMMLKTKISHKQKRANLFVQAIENGVRKVLGE